MFRTAEESLGSAEQREGSDELPLVDTKVVASDRSTPRSDSKPVFPVVNTLEVAPAAALDRGSETAVMGHRLARRPNHSARQGLP